MTDKKRRNLRAGLTTTQTRTQTQTTTDALTPEEERAVRMVHGLGESGDFELTFERSSDPEVNARLQLIEAALLAEMHGLGPLSEGESDSPKSKILAHLKRIEKDD